MASNPQPRRRRGRRGWLARSFALRLGVGFALVALVGAGVTAAVVNSVFAARFDRYLAQQQAAQLGQIGTALSRAYTGQGRWDPTALATLVPTVGSGTVRVLTPAGQDVWHWDGHQMGWDDRWMDEGGQHAGQSTGHSSQSGGWDGGNQGDQRGSGHSTQPSSGNHDGQQRTGPTQPTSTSGWDGQGSGSGRHDLGWSQGDVVAAGLPLADSAPGLLTVAAVTTTLPPTTRTTATTASTTAAGLGPVQRVPIQVGGTVVGTALVQLPQPTALPAAVAFRAQVIRLLLGGGTLGALLSLGLGIVLARRASRPVRQVTGAARALAAGDRAVRLDTGRADEFGELGRAFNAMADAVQTQERLRQTFAAEVAHELRTPLTILRSQVEGLRVGVLAPTGQALGSLDEEVGRMTRLVADLQVLSAADAAGFTLDRASTQLDGLVKQVTDEFAGLFEGAEVGLETRLEPVTAWVDRVRVGQVVANLLSNALKFTPQGGLVRVQLQADGDQAVLQVADSGPGIPAEELPHIFDRFWRGRAARAAGTGIGLTVVRELVEAHGGTVQAASQPGYGATFTVRLPLQLQATPPDNRFHTASSQLRPTVRA